MTLSEFLLARIAGDVAQASGVGDVHTYAFIGDKPGVVLSGDRWRAECQAKRRIVQSFEARRVEKNRVAVLALYPAMRALAAIYADHPDYREEWVI